MLKFKGWVAGNSAVGRKTCSKALDRENWGRSGGTRISASCISLLEEDSV